MEKNFETLIDLWFDPKVKPLWYNSTQAFDSQLRQDYLELYHSALTSNLQHWQETALGSLALVILLDQIPLNIFRGEAECFAAEQVSRDVATDAITRGFDKALNGEQKAFLYLPFMHSEDISDQDKSLALFKEAGLNDNLKYAEHHRDIILRFGRFPHRNSILGRVNSKAETEYLASENAFLG
ncbi:MAG: DUF924 family protein [Thiohalomonadales bacterium]